MKQLSLFREIIVDNFAGGGGASTGIEMATGMSVDIAINHDPAAIAMHRVNHPDTEHYCESVWDVNPKEAVNGRKVGLAWFSPDCKHFSKAKGGKPVDKKVRGLAWIAVKWAIAVKPRVIMLENVEEFKTWGPLKDGYPDENRKGQTFQSFVKALESLGYQVEFKELRACDYGAPTTRKRFFMIARCDGKAIKWPEPTHGNPDSLEVQVGKLLPWRTASEIIDWSIGTPSIFDRKKPLAENTMRRIARGIERFVINNPSPFIVRIGQTGFGGDRLQYQLNKPLTTITTKAEHCLVTPMLLVNTTGHSGSKLDEPIKTITTGGHHALVTPFLATYYTETTKNGVRGQTLKEPIATIPTANRFGLVNAFLTKYYGSDIGQQMDEPLHTITTRDRFGLVTIHGQDYKIVDIGMRMLQPHELFAAQGFPKNYVIDKDFEGKTYPKTAQVARCGNAVPPPFAEALVRANLPEMCASSSRYAMNI
ncbi:DNA cytosine methyltransferase [Lysinibacillus sp. BSL11]